MSIPKVYHIGGSISAAELISSSSIAASSISLAKTAPDPRELLCQAMSDAASGKRILELGSEMSRMCAQSFNDGVRAAIWAYEAEDAEFGGVSDDFLAHLEALLIPVKG